MVNDPATAAALRAALRDALPDVPLHVMNPLPNSEDFSTFTEHAPGAYALIGAHSAAKHICHPRSTRCSTSTSMACACSRRRRSR